MTSRFHRLLIPLLTTVALLLGTTLVTPITHAQNIHRTTGHEPAVNLPPTVTQFEVPASLSTPGQVKFEITASSHISGPNLSSA